MIFSIERRRFRRDGKVEETRSYYLRYRIGDMPVDKWKSLGVTDKQVADKKGHEFIQERERETAGILEPKAVRDSAKKPLMAHLDDYVADLAARGRNGRGGRGARLVASRIKALLQACEWQVPCNVTADSFIVWRNRQTCSPRTLNHYLQGMISLLNWMEKAARIKTNPLKNVSRADERGKQKRVRRAFTDDEMRKLVAGSEDRGIIYFTAARTGLRQEELKQMKWGDLRLDAAVPFVVVRDYAAKNKKEESVQLVPEIEVKAADEELEVKDLHLGREEAGEEVGVAGSEAAIDGGDDVFATGEIVELERVLGEEGDVDDILPVLDDGLKRAEAHVTGDGADDQMRIADGIADFGGISEIGDAGVDRKTGRERFEGSVVDIGGGYLEFIGQIGGDCLADAAGAQNDNFLTHSLPRLCCGVFCGCVPLAL